VPTPVIARTKAWVCCHSLAGIVGSSRTGGMDVCLLLVLCVVRYKSLRRSDHSSRGVLPSVVCPMSVIANPRKGRPGPGIGPKRHRKNNFPGGYQRLDALSHNYYPHTYSEPFKGYINEDIDFPYLTKLLRSGRYGGIRILSKLKLSIHVVNYICTCKGGYRNDKLQRIGS
jgi:hypothetical protein